MVRERSPDSTVARFLGHTAGYDGAEYDRDGRVYLRDPRRFGTRANLDFMAESPDIRIGTVEREQAMRRLSDHFAAGRLSVAEFDERSAVVAAAVTRGDLTKVFADLPGPVSTAKPARRRDDRDAGWRHRVMPLVVIAAAILALSTGHWLWFLAIPAAGALLFGSNRRRRRR